MEPILEMEGASAGRGTTFCLRDVCLAVEPGMLMGVIGRNGAGKTTLFHMVCGLCRVSSGSVRIDGVSVRHEPERCKKEIGVVFDDDFFRLDLTVKAAGEIYGMYYERYSKQDFLGYCRQFEVDVRQNIRKLSKGNYMKFQLAFALAHHPKLLLLDEPDAGLDPVFRKEWMGILYDVREEGCGVLYATHLTEGLEQYADAVTMLSRGRQVFSLTMPELWERYKIVRGSKAQMDYLQKRLAGRRKMEHYEEGLFVEDGKELWVEVQTARPTLADLMCYLDQEGGPINYARPRPAI